MRQVLRVDYSDAAHLQEDSHEPEIGCSPGVTHYSVEDQVPETMVKPVLGKLVVAVQEVDHVGDHELIPQGLKLIREGGLICINQGLVSQLG